MLHGSFVARAVVAGAAALSLAGPAAAQPLPDGQRQLVDKVFTVYDKDASPGCALAVYRNGEIAYARGYGLASLEHRVPITPKTVFDIGSTSKQFTAFSILLLERDGKLSLDDDVRKYGRSCSRSSRWSPSATSCCTRAASATTSRCGRSPA